MAIERYEEAIEDFSRAIAFEPRNAEIYALRGAAYLEADNAASGVKDFAKAIELEPDRRRVLRRARARLRQGRGLRGCAQRFRAAPSSSSRARPRPTPIAPGPIGSSSSRSSALKDVERALKLDANSAEAYWARGEINEALGRAELAVADLRKALALDPRLKAAAQALERLGVSTRPSEAEVAEAGFDRWRVFQKGRQFVATNEEFPRLKINLEMMGKGQPRILEWDVKKPPFAGIAVLRFHAGVVDGPKGPEEVEHAAVVDLQSSTVVSVEVQRQGEQAGAVDLGRRQARGRRRPTASPTSSSCARASRRSCRRQCSPIAPPSSASASPGRCSSCCSASER